MALIVGWLALGPLVHFTDTYQLVINTATSVITFVMVFAIQHTTNRETRAINLKLDELIEVMEGTDRRLVGVEEMSESAIKDLQKNEKARAGSRHAHVRNDRRPPRRPLAEERPAEADRRGPLLHRHLEVGAHPHAQLGQGMCGALLQLVAQRAQPGEDGTRVVGVVDRRGHRHQAAQPQDPQRRDRGHRRGEVAGGEARVPRQAGELHLEEHLELADLRRTARREQLGEADAVDRVDHREGRRSPAPPCWSGGWPTMCQRTSAGELGPLGDRLLDAVLAEVGHPRGHRLGDALGGHRLGDAIRGPRRGRAPALGGGGDAGPGGGDRRGDPVILSRPRCGG